MSDQQMTDQARTLLHEWVQTESLRKHCEAVSAAMHYFAEKNGEDVDLWTATGLLHDMDFERYPELKADESSHPYVAVRYLRENGWGEDVCRAILSHADYSGVEPVSAMEKTLCAVDELSGFVTAVALVRPDKSIHQVKSSSVRKKLKDKSFAAKVNRDDITLGAERLGMPMDELIDEVIVALALQADRLGIAGESAATG